ncbi:MAG: DUF47 family protein [Promethearchaeota archaeon]
MKKKSNTRAKSKSISSDELREILKILKESSIKMVDLVEHGCNETDQGRELVEGLIMDIIASEKRVDRLKEEFIKNLYTKKRYLPTFQKLDNVMIINKLDEIEDLIEIVARYFKIYPYHFHDDIKEDLKAFARESGDVVVSLSEAVRLMYLDFNGAQDACLVVENERREARESQWHLQEKLFKLDITARDLMMVRALIRVIIKVVEKCEMFSDDLRSIAIKYSALD